MGEMEKDALLSHSVPHVLVERLMHFSDAYEMNVCACGRDTFHSWRHVTAATGRRYDDGALRVQVTAAGIAGNVHRLRLT